MNQMTFSNMEYSGRKKITQKEKFLQAINEIIPWTAWIAMIQQYYPEGKCSRPTHGIEVMFRDVSASNLVQSFRCRIRRCYL